MTPRYPNYCHKCIFLGRHKKLDLYYCRSIDSYVAALGYKGDVQLAFVEAFKRAQQALLPLN